MVDTERGVSEAPRAYPSIWLSLSGGGFRAALFHYGCLKRLHELGLLRHVYAVAATSGGSLVAALLGQHWRGAPTEEEKGRGIHLDSVDWDAFERTLLQLALRGILGPTSILVSAYCAYAVGLSLFALLLFDQGSALRQAINSVAWVTMAAGGLLHMVLIAALLGEGAHRASAVARRAAALDTKKAHADWARASLWRLVRMVTWPSFLRRQTLNLRALHGGLLTSLFTRPKTFITAVDLDSGREVVFTAGLCAGLDATGCRALWDQRTSNSDWRSDEIEVAEAVCASSAIPPVFKPVEIRNRRGLLGVFVDGGVFDNLALNVAKALAVHIHADRGQRYDSASRLASFKDQTSLILAIDGGKLPVARRGPWGRLRMIRRLVGILVDQQFDRTMLDAMAMERMAGIDTVLVGLHVGTPPDSEINDDRVSESLPAVRTHFDAFSLEECAAIAHWGYLWTEHAVRSRLAGYAHAAWVPPRAFATILPEYCGAWDPSPAHLCTHLQYSQWRFGPARWIGRALAQFLSKGS